MTCCILFQEYANEVKSKQSEFDDLNERTQLLLTTSSDAHVTAQLTQLSSRYTALLSYNRVSTCTSLFLFISARFVGDSQIEYPCTL